MGWLQSVGSIKNDRSLLQSIVSFIGLFCKKDLWFYRSYQPKPPHSLACSSEESMGWLRLVGSIKLYVSFAKEPYKRDDILHKRPVILSILLTVATPCHDTAYHWVFWRAAKTCLLFRRICYDKVYHWVLSWLSISLGSLIIKPIIGVSHDKAYHWVLWRAAKLACSSENPHRNPAFASCEERIFLEEIISCEAIKLQVSYAEYRLFYRALLQKRLTILRETSCEEITSCEAGSCVCVCICLFYKKALQKRRYLASFWRDYFLWSGQLCVCVYMSLSQKSPTKKTIFGIFLKRLLFVKRLPGEILVCWSH